MLLYNNLMTADSYVVTDLTVPMTSDGYVLSDNAT
jgi:hypothetical protein